MSFHFHGQAQARTKLPVDFLHRVAKLGERGICTTPTRTGEDRQRLRMPLQFQTRTHAPQATENARAEQPTVSTQAAERTAQNAFTGARPPGSKRARRGTDARTQGEFTQPHKDAQRTAAHQTEHAGNARCQGVSHRRPLELAQPQMCNEKRNAPQTNTRRAPALTRRDGGGADLRSCAHTEETPTGISEQRRERQRRELKAKGRQARSCAALIELSGATRAHREERTATNSAAVSTGTHSNANKTPRATPHADNRSVVPTQKRKETQSHARRATARSAPNETNTEEQGGHEHAGNARRQGVKLAEKRTAPQTNTRRAPTPRRERTKRNKRSGARRPRATQRTTQRTRKQGKR